TVSSIDPEGMTSVAALRLNRSIRLSNLAPTVRNVSGLRSLRLPRPTSRSPDANVNVSPGSALNPGAAPGFKAEPGETFTLASGDLLVGLGKRNDLKPETLRTVGARLLKRMDRLSLKAATLVIPSGSIDETVA